MTQDYLWWRDGIIYQIYPRSFQDSNGDGIGDLPGIVSRLDYLRDLDVDAIWLSPINRSPMKDFGYDVSDYYDIDPNFGTLADFEELVSQAHRRGIRVIMDMVMNHSSDEHPWFIESRSSRDNPRRDWYIWRDGMPVHKPPNNWQSVFGGSAWDFDAKTGQYYLHLFLPGQPDLNWRNPEVKQAMFNVCRYWLERGVDGFRLDVAHFLDKHPGLPDNPFKWGLRAYDRQDHAYHKNRPGTHAIWKAFRTLLDQYAGRMAVGEVDLDGAEVYYGTGGDELHLVFNFGLLRQKWNPQAFQHVITDWEARLPGDAWPCWVLSNHDTPRHISRWGSGPQAIARAKVVAALLLTLRGTPFMYYGEEIGMTQTPIPRAEILDPPGKRYWPFYKGRDGCRTPMQWDNTPNAGFTAGKPWLRVNRHADQVNVQRELADPDSLLSFYRRLIVLRKTTPALQRGSYRPLLDRPTQLMAYVREYAGQKVVVCLNFSSQPAQFDLRVTGAGEWQILISTAARNTDTLRGEVKLYPDEALVLM